MTIEELYNYLNSPSFQNTDGNLFYNYYIYQYSATQEYQIRKDILDFKQRLERPNTFINAMVLDLFQAFCDYLKKEKFDNTTSLFDKILEEDKTIPDTVTKELTDEANSDYFLQYVSQLINNHMNSNSNLKRPYVFIHGIGKIFPYLRTNVFLTKYEKYNDTSKYKIILFYPGHQARNSFSLFDKLNDSHTYRAILLVNQKPLNYELPRFI